MKKTDEVLLALIRCVVRGGSEESLPVSGVDWNRVYGLSVRQKVPALVADGLQAFLSLHPEVKPFADETAADKMKRMQWLGLAMMHDQMYARHVKAMVGLARIYEKAGIRMMVLKGYGLSLDWPVPAHRSMGDLDIYHFGEWRKADALLAAQCGIKPDEGHEHHTVFEFEDISVENHYDFINTKAHRDAPAIEARLKAMAERGSVSCEVCGTKVWLPPADFNALFLMRHMGQHFAGEYLNLRQVLDWGFFVRAHREELDWSATVGFLREIGLDRFFQQVNAICVDYLGFPEDVFSPIEREPDLERRILEDILHPEFAEEKPTSGLPAILAFKFRRWKSNRWKHTLIYKEHLLPMFFTLLWSHLRRFKTLGD